MNSDIPKKVQFHCNNCGEDWKTKNFSINRHGHFLKVLQRAFLWKPQINLVNEVYDFQSRCPRCWRWEKVTQEIPNTEHEYVQTNDDQML